MRLPKIIVPAIIIIGVVVFQSLFIVQEISQAIVLQFGDPKKIITKAGLNFKLPFIQNVVYLDKRILNLDLTVGIGEGSMLVDNREIYTAQGLKVGLFQDTSSF